MVHKLEIDGVEVDVFTTEEVAARETAARSAVEGEWKPKFTASEEEQGRLNKLLEERSKMISGMDAKFKKLSDEQYAKLEEKDRIIYDNQIVLSQERERSAQADEKAYEAAVSAAIRARVGNDEKLFTEARKMYDIVQLDDVTTEGITARAAAALGALGGMQPDLLASAGWGGGGYEPPRRETGKESIADTERGKDIAARLGIAITEEDVKKQAQRG